MKIYDEKMEETNAFKCLQCGNCCRKTGGFDTVAIKDVERWKKQGREDILKYVGNKTKDEEGGDAYEFTAYPYIGDFDEVEKRKPCAFLEKKDRKYFCKIHGTKPTVCKDFPAICGNTISYHDYCKGIKAWMNK